MQSRIYFLHYLATQFTNPVFQSILIESEELGAVDMPTARQVTVTLRQYNRKRINSW